MKSRRGSDDEGEPAPPARNGGIPVVGIGASAGGLRALQTLLPLLTPKSGLAYVVVQHLDPLH